MIENYVAYLKFLDEKFNRFFERQKPYIFCKKGCCKCCKNAHFPYTQIEINYLVAGTLLLPSTTQDIIANNITQLLNERKNNKDKLFRYDCPFLINNECSVYEYRGIICRSFGLMTIGADKKIKVPFCWKQGLNYSNVMQDDGKKVSKEKLKNLNINEEPLAFNINYELLTDSDVAKRFNFEFGKTKPLIEWFDNDNKKYVL